MFKGGARHRLFKSCKIRIYIVHLFLSRFVFVKYIEERRTDRYELKGQGFFDA